MNQAQDIRHVNYFPNLDALRFIAASLVIIHHVELYKSLFRMENVYDSSSFVHIAGKLGVVLFFVLSGFLIFSLLVKEMETMGKINTKHFYYRRILRIWPLYFLILALAFLVLPNISLFHLDVQYAQGRILTPVLYSAMLPNLASVLYLILPYAGQLWSLGIEEQMYLVSPLLLNFTRKTAIILLSVIVLTIILKTFFWLKAGSDVEWNSHLYVFNNFSYSCIAIGALTAYAYFHLRVKILEVLFKSWVQVLVWAASILLLLSGTFFSVFQFEIFAVLFAVIILNLACNKKSIIRLDTPMLNYLGKISFGLYMYHAITIVLVIRVLSMFEIKNSAMIYGLVFLSTIVLAILSYEFFEKQFLRIKSKLQV